MNTFRVWVRPLAGASRLRVEGLDHSHWLLDRLSRAFFFKDSQPMVEERASACCTFRVLYPQRSTGKALDALLRAIPEVQLMPEPA
jgi:hypothetical protein